jgi:hypothetical protein
MNVTQRQILQHQRRMTAALAAAQAPAARDEPIYRPEELRRGLARIKSRGEEDGQYKVTELWWDPTSQEWSEADTRLGYVEADALDYMLNPNGQAGQIVPFWEHRAREGELELFIDVNGGSDGRQKISAGTYHYSGSNTTSAFHTVSGAKYAFLEMACDVRMCSQHVPPADHPAATGMDLTNGFWDNSWATWAGSNDWRNVFYTGHDQAGMDLGDGQDPITNFFIQCRVNTSSGSLELRAKNQRGGVVSCVIALAVRLTYFEEPPDVQEIGNCCCHENDGEDWGDDEYQSD